MQNIFEPTGVNVEILKRDANEYCGIENLDDISISRLAVICDNELVHLEDNFPSRHNKIEWDRYLHKNAAVIQVYQWGLFYLTDTMENPKATTAEVISRDGKPLKSGWLYDNACRYLKLLELIK